MYDFRCAVSIWLFKGDTALGYRDNSVWQVLSGKRLCSVKEEKHRRQLWCYVNDMRRRVSSICHPIDIIVRQRLPQSQSLETGFSTDCEHAFCVHLLVLSRCDNPHGDRTNLMKLRVVFADHVHAIGAVIGKMPIHGERSPTYPVEYSFRPTVACNRNKDHLLGLISFKRDKFGVHLGRFRSRQAKYFRRFPRSFSRSLFLCCYQEVLGSEPEHYTLHVTFVARWNPVCSLFGWFIFGLPMPTHTLCRAIFFGCLFQAITRVLDASCRTCSWSVSQFIFSD